MRSWRAQQIWDRGWDRRSAAPLPFYSRAKATEIHSAARPECLSCLQTFRQLVETYLAGDTPNPTTQRTLIIDFQQYYYQMAGRYERTDPVTLYHHQKSHYEHIFNPRSTMRIEPENRRSFSLQRKNKSCNEKDRQRRIQNKKMLVNLLDIYNNKAGLLTRVEEESKAKSSQKKRPFYSSYKKEQEEKEILKNNRDLFYSILHVGPSVGTQKEWDEHYEQHCRIEKKLCNHLANDYHGLNQFRQSYTKERMRRKMGEGSAREDRDCGNEQPGNEVATSHKISQRKKKWMKKKALLAEKELNQAEKQAENMANVTVF